MSLAFFRSVYLEFHLELAKTRTFYKISKCLSGQNKNTRKWTCISFSRNKIDNHALLNVTWDMFYEIMKVTKTMVNVNKIKMT